MRPRRIQFEYRHWIRKDIEGMNEAGVIASVVDGIINDIIGSLKEENREFVKTYVDYVFFSQRTMNNT